MPRGDRTGPMGLGPRTGRAMGYCAGYSAPGFMNPGPGLGLARGFGRSTGFGRGMAFGPGWAGAGRGRFGGYPPLGVPVMTYMPSGYPVNMPPPFAPGYGYPFPMGYRGYPWI